MAGTNGYALAVIFTTCIVYNSVIFFFWVQPSAVVQGQCAENKLIVKQPIL